MSTQLVQITPADLGITNPKFQAFRPQQLEALSLVHTVYETEMPPLPVPMLSIPTGGGKYLIGFAIAKQYASMGIRTIILTHSKGLQDQAEEDSSMDGLQVMKGRNNYDCIRGHGDCETGVYRGCNAGPACTYNIRRDICKNDNIVLANYQYWLAINRHMPGQRPLGEFGVIVCDEAHVAAGLLSSALTVRMVPAELPKKFPHMDLGQSMLESFPHLHEAPAPRAHFTDKLLAQIGENIARMQEWGKTCTPAVVAHQKDLLEQIKKDPRANVIDGIKKGAELLESMKLLTSMNTDNWVVDMPREEESAGFTVKHPTQLTREFVATPIWVGPYTNYLFDGINLRVMMSATLLKTAGAGLGMKAGSTVYKEWARVFPSDRNPVYYCGLVALSSKTESDPKTRKIIIDQIVEVLRQYPDEKGIIHTVSYPRMEWIYDELSKRRDIKHVIMKHERQGKWKSYEGGQQVVDRYLESTVPTVLLSAVLSTGWDFSDDACRFIIIPKLPFKPTNDLASRVRQQKNSTHSIEEVLIEFTQMCGRGSRHINDWCATYVLDRSWAADWFQAKIRNIKPKSLIVQPAGSDTVMGIPRRTARLR